MADDRRSPLHLDPDEMRRMGYRTVDMLVERLTGDPGPVVGQASFDDLRERLSSPPPEGPLPFDEALAALERDVLPFVARLGHPGYLAFIPGEGTWPGALGDLIASALNVDTCWWLGASGPTALELVVIDWFKQWVGYPAEASGLLTSGGSASNMTALACAREALLGPMDDSAVAYMSDQTHSSMARAARVLGFRPDQVRVIPTDREMRIRVDGLRGAIAHDLAAGRRPLAVIANAGATGAGAVDPFAELAEVCRQHDAWLHVDGAYGGFAVLTERGNGALAGIELADSITLDPHKWLYQPVEAGALLVRNGALLRHAFEITPDYLKDVEVRREVNFSDLGIQLTRTCRAIKLWLSLRTFGVGAFRQAIDRCLDLAAAAQERIERSPSLELLTPASLGIVTFRRRPDGIDDEPTLDRLNAALAEQVEQGGEVFVSTGRVRGRLALRLCILNHSTTMAEVERAIELVETLDVETAAPPPRRRHEGSDIEAGWLGRPQLDADGLRSLPLFSTLDDVAAQRVLRSAREHVALGNDAIVDQWSASRDLYVILSGGVNIVADGRAVASLGPGEFFGEIAAIDWGASYGRPRVASAIAIRRSRLLVLDPDLVQWLMSVDPAVADRIERTARERLAAR